MAGNTELTPFAQEQLRKKRAQDIADAMNKFKAAIANPAPIQAAIAQAAVREAAPAPAPPPVPSVGSPFLGPIAPQQFAPPTTPTLSGKTLTLFGKPVKPFKPASIILKPLPKKLLYPDRNAKEPFKTADSKTLTSLISALDDLSKAVPVGTKDAPLSALERSWSKAKKQVYADRKKVLTDARDAIEKVNQIRDEQGKALVRGETVPNAELFIKQYQDDGARALTYEDKYGKIQADIEGGPGTPEYNAALADMAKYKSENSLIDTNRNLRAVQQRYAGDPQYGGVAGRLNKTLTAPPTVTLQSIAEAGGPQIALGTGRVIPAKGFSTPGSRAAKGGGLTLLSKYLNLTSVPTSLPAKTWANDFKKMNLANLAQDQVKNQQMYSTAIDSLTKIMQQHPERVPELQPDLDKYKAKMEQSGKSLSDLYNESRNVNTNKDLLDILKLKSSTSFAEPIKELGNIDPHGAAGKLLQNNWFNRSAGMALDITANPLTYTAGPLSTTAKLAGVSGEVYNQGLISLLTGVEHPVVQGMLKTAESLHLPAAGKVVSTSALGKIAKKVSTPIKNQIVAHGQSLAKGIHAQPAMTDAEKAVLWNYNTAKAISTGIPLETYKTGAKLAKSQESRLVHPLARFKESRAMKAEQRPIYGDFYDVSNHNLSPEERSVAMQDAYAHARDTGNLDWVNHNLQVGRDIKQMEVPAGFLQKERAAYLPGILEDSGTTWRQREMARIREGASGEGTILAPTEETPLWSRALPGRNANSPFDQARTGAMFEDISNARPGFVKDPQMALAQRERSAFSHVLGNRQTQLIPGAKVESEEVMSRVANTVDPERLAELDAMKPTELRTTEEYRTAQGNFRADMKDAHYKEMASRTGNPIDRETILRSQLSPRLRELPTSELEQLPAYQAMKANLEQDLGPGAVAFEPTMEKTWVPERTAGFINDPTYGLKAPYYPTSVLGKIVRKPTDKWRKLATVWKGPAYAGTRAIGDPYRAFQGGLMPSLGDLQNSIRMMRGKVPGDIKLAGGRKVSGEEADRLVKGLNIAQGGLEWSQGKKGFNPWTRFWQGEVTGQQKLFRQAEFLKGLRKTGQPGSALEALNRVGFNFQDLSALEARYGKTAAPFLAWNRKNIPFQLKTAITNPGKAVPFAAATHALSGAPLNPTESFLQPGYVQNQGYINTGMTAGGNPVSILPKLPINSLNFLPNLLENPEESSFLLNPLVSAGAEYLTGKTRTGIDLNSGLKQTVSNPVGELLSKVGWATQDPDVKTGKKVWKVSPKVPWGMGILPPLAAANQMLRTDVTDRGQRIASRLLPLDILPQDYEKNYRNKMVEQSIADAATQTGLSSYKGMDTSGRGAFPFKPIQVTPGAADQKTVLKLNNMKPTQSNLDKIQAAYAAQGNYSPAPWATLQDVVNAGKKGYVYSYNKPLMTPAQITAASAGASKSGSSWGGGYSRRSYGGGGGHGGGGGGKKVATIKAKKAVKTKQLQKAVPKMSLPAALASIAPIKMPAGLPGAKAPSSLTAIKAMVAAGGGMKPTKSKMPSTGGASTAMPANMAASLSAIVSNFMAQRGGPTPENVDALRAMLAKQGALTPEVMAIISQMTGGVPVGR